jgi:hypothetical protein
MHLGAKFRFSIYFVSKYETNHTQYDVKNINSLHKYIIFYACAHYVLLHQQVQLRAGHVNSCMKKLYLNIEKKQILKKV